MKSFEEWCKERQSFMCEDITPHILSLYKIYGEECYQRLIACEAENKELTRKARQLEEENAALHERLNILGDLPFAIGDDCFIVLAVNYGVVECEITEIEKTKDNIWVGMRDKEYDSYHSLPLKDCYGNIWFTDRTAAEKRLAELGEK